MANAETPTISGYAHTHSTYDGTGTAVHQMLQQAQVVDAQLHSGDAAMRGRRMLLGASVAPALKAMIMEAKKEDEMSKRYVQIFIADPDPKVPVGKSLLHFTQPAMTDLTDQELFYEIEIKRVLDHYNETVRTKTVDKEIKDRTAYLEPARIRDLVMNVTTIAKFGA
jgi:hypothetical protein